MLVGEPGIGKTRTAQELATYAERRGAQVLWGRCYEGEGAPPYWPWVQPLRSYIQKMAPDLLASNLGRGAPEIAEVVPEVRLMLPDLPNPPELDPEQARFRLYDSIATFFKNVTQSQPLTVVLDDLHWADRSSLLLLEFLAQEIHSIPLLLLGTYRDMEVARRHPLYQALGSLIREQRFVRIQLHGLNQPEVGQLLHLNTGTAPSTGLVETIQGRTEGNPLFINEISRVLSQLDVKPGQDLLGAIPEGVKEAVSRRLDRLSEGCNQLLTIASVIGKEFDFQVLEVLLKDTHEEQFQEFLDEALESHTIEEVPGFVERCQFSYALIQETLYQELSTRRKVRLHAQIGEALEEIYGSNVVAHAGELAYHFVEAETVTGTEKLVRYAKMAGEQALVSHAYEEALLHFERALAAKEGQPMDSETAAILYGLGQAQVAALERVEGEEAWDSLSRAFDYYVEAGDIDKAVTVAQFQPSGTFGTRGELVRRALDLVPADSHEAGWLQSRYIRILGQARGDREGAQKAFEQALAIALREQDRDLEMVALVAAAHDDAYNFRLEESLQKDLRAIGLASVLNQPVEETHARYELASVLYELGDLEGAALHAGAALEPAERSGSLNWRLRAMSINGVVLSAKGEWDAAGNFYERGLAISPRDPLLLHQRAVLEYQVGNFGQGKAYLERSKEAVQPLDLTTSGAGELRPFIANPVVDLILGIEHPLETLRTEAKVVASSSNASHIAQQ